MTTVLTGGLFEYTRRPIFVSASVRIGYMFNQLSEVSIIFPRRAAVRTRCHEAQDISE
jgi:hypothetical protein